MGNRPSSVPHNTTAHQSTTLSPQPGKGFNSLPNSHNNTPHTSNKNIKQIYSSNHHVTAQYTYNSPLHTDSSNPIHRLLNWTESHQYINNRLFICKFCNGKLCKHENYLLQTDRVPAVTGLNSTWITNNIIAMQRPSTRINQQYNIVQQFISNNIYCIINLQLSGEHRACGDGIGTNGFSYHNDEYNQYNISVYNYGFEDMSIPTVYYMHDVCKIIAYHIVCKKHNIAVHCHAGYGRTGLVIACALLYIHYTLTPQQAINTVRTQRIQCIQTSKQQQFVHTFWTYLMYLRCVYKVDSLTTTLHCISYQQLLQRQSVYLHGDQVQQYRTKHKLIELICNRIHNELTQTDQLNNLLNVFVNGYSTVRWDHKSTQQQSVVQSLTQLMHSDYSSYIQYDNVAALRSITSSPPKFTLHNQHELLQYKTQINQSNYTCISDKSVDIQYIVVLLYDLFDQWNISLIHIDCNALHTSINVKHVFDRQIITPHYDTLDMIIPLINTIIQLSLQNIHTVNLTLLYSTLLKFGTMLCMTHQSHDSLTTVTTPLSCNIRYIHKPKSTVPCNTYSIQQYNSLITCIIELCCTWNESYTKYCKLQLQQNSTKPGILNIKYKLHKLLSHHRKHTVKLTNHDIESSIVSVCNQWSAISHSLHKINRNDSSPHMMVTPTIHTNDTTHPPNDRSVMQPKSLFTHSPDNNNNTMIAHNKQLQLSSESMSNDPIVSPPYITIHNTPVPSNDATLHNLSSIQSYDTPSKSQKPTQSIFSFDIQQSVSTDKSNTRRSTNNIRISPQPSHHNSKIPLIHTTPNSTTSTPRTTINNVMMVKQKTNTRQDNHTG